MKVAPYFCTKKKTEGDGEWEKDMNKGHNQKGKGVLKKTSAGKRKTNERQRDHL